jgi:hypothetical protein
MDKKNLFDQKIRDAINKFEVPFDDSLWEGIQKEIQAPVNTPVYNLKPWIITAAIAASLVVAYFAFVPESKNNEQFVEKDTIETKEPKIIETEQSSAQENENQVHSTQDVEKNTNQPGETNSKKKNEINLGHKEDENTDVGDEQLVAKEKEETKELKNDSLDKEDEESQEKEREEESLLVNIEINKKTLCLNE